MVTLKLMMHSIKSFFTYKVYAWVVVVLMAVVGVAYFKGQLNQDGTKVQVSSTVNYLEKVEETVFLNVGIQKVMRLSRNTKLFGTTIPLTEKTALVILNYKAKLGVKKAVQIKQTGEKEYTVRVPSFEVIGFEWDDHKGYELYDTSGELLSVATKEIDTGAAVAEETTAKKQKAYLKQYRAELEEAAREYYTNLFYSINPDLTITVSFD